jgi:Transposase IS4
MIRFDDKSTRDARLVEDKAAAVRELMEHFQNAFVSNYKLSENATLDEMLPSFRGRCKFRQYMPNKPSKYGLKFQVMHYNCKQTFSEHPLHIYS